MKAQMDEQMIKWMIGYENFFFGFNYIIFRNAENFINKKILKEHKFEKKNEESFGIFRNI